MKVKEYEEFSVSLKECCEKRGITQYFSIIRNRILDKVEEDENLSFYVLGDPDNPEDIYLSENGIFVFFRILTDYFEIDYLKSMEYYLSEKNALDKVLDSLHPKDIKKTLLTTMAYNPQSVEEEKLKQIIIENASQKIKSNKKRR